MMVFVNEFTNAETKPLSALRTLLVLLNPFAPHITSELWATLASAFPGGPVEIMENRWPEHDPAHLIEDEVEIIVQVNGKLRDRMRVALDLPEDELKAQALASLKVMELTAGKTIRKVIVIPKKLVNVVAS